MSEQNSHQNQEQVAKPETNSDESANESGSKRLGCIIPKAILEQLTFDPVEKGPYITVDNSPRSGRNVNVIKAKLREQELNHTLEIIQIKKEHTTKEDELTKAVAGLQSSLSELQGQIETEVKLRKDAERRDEQTSKDLLIISGKCGELQGRLDESHAALQESRAYIKTLQATQEERLAEMKNYYAESEQKHQDTRKEMERKIRDLEEQLIEIRSSFQKTLGEKLDQWKAKEMELVACIKQGEERHEKILEEKNELTQALEQTKMELREASEGREQAMVELGELKEYHRLELERLSEDHTNVNCQLQLQLNEQVESSLSEIRQVQDQLNEVTTAKDELLAEKERNGKKHDESIKVLKNALTVLDEQNKELTAELKRLQDKCEEKETVSATLAAQVNLLVAVRDEAQAEKQKLMEELTTIDDVAKAKASEISNLQEELLCTRNNLTKELEDKKAVIDDLETTLKKFQENTDQMSQDKNDQIEKLGKKLEEEQRKVATNNEEIQRMGDSVRDCTDKLDSISAKYDSSKQQVTKLNLEMSRLINEVVNCKEENIDLKSGLNEALQKCDFYKDRNFALTEQLAEIQRQKTEKEADLLAEVEEKQSLIEYLQKQAATPGGSEKKKRRFFQSKSASCTPSSPAKMDIDNATSVAVNNEDSPP